MKKKIAVSLVAAFVALSGVTACGAVQDEVQQEVQQQAEDELDRQMTRAEQRVEQEKTRALEDARTTIEQGN